MLLTDCTDMIGIKGRQLHYQGDIPFDNQESHCDFLIERNVYPK